MLILLFVLAILYTICTAILHTLIKKKNFGMSHSAFSAIQGICMGASVVILLKRKNACLIELNEKQSVSLDDLQIVFILSKVSFFINKK
ncbi:hypothetical protein [Listeria aquatica]|uniref:Uncharacterized protein n=1 Tax=Listeria aquatica FSL S10-1188 TaxID=1265818 RepID=W7B3J2_9LIST|nr:hypothetical protein [Listeria aquatica]EUJ21844.1 hypothetical protein MAQA_00540 [Listeria aquatica FSL S10-1188]